jgi:oligoendopeptidase F
MGLFTTYERYKNTLAATYGGSVKKDAFFSQVRNYESSLQSALYPNAIPLEVYDRLIEAIHQGLPELQRYMALKKKALGLEELHMYDLYAPLVEETRKDIPYAEALEDVRQALQPLGERYIKELDKGLTSGWIDVYENRGKRSGAYSWGTYGAHPYVLLNYNGTLRDVFTLAHEMGHALHSSFTYAVQPYVYGGHDIFTAEVASITNENLLLDHMISNAATREEKLYLLNYALEQIRTTVFRQVLFAEFEKITHEKARQGEPLTPDVLSTLWRELNTAYYGTQTVIDPEIDIEWARIPHFYSAFYVYQYATGYAAAASLAEQILTEGEPAVARYLAFLESGDSAYPIDLLKRAGVDMTSPEPVQAVLHRFSRWLNQLEELLEE